MKHARFWSNLCTNKPFPQSRFFIHNIIKQTWNHRQRTKQQSRFIKHNDNTNSCRWTNIDPIYVLIFLLERSTNKEQMICVKKMEKSIRKLSTLSSVHTTYNTSNNGPQHATTDFEYCNFVCLFHFMTPNCQLFSMFTVPNISTGALVWELLTDLVFNAGW